MKSYTQPQRSFSFLCCDDTLHFLLSPLCVWMTVGHVLPHQPLQLLWFSAQYDKYTWSIWLCMHFLIRVPAARVPLQNVLIWFKLCRNRQTVGKSRFQPPQPRADLSTPAHSITATYTPQLDSVQDSLKSPVLFPAFSTECASVTADTGTEGF